MATDNPRAALEPVVSTGMLHQWLRHHDCTTSVAETARKQSMQKADSVFILFIYLLSFTTHRDDTISYKDNLYRSIVLINIQVCCLVVGEELSMIY